MGNSVGGDADVDALLPPLQNMHLTLPPPPPYPPEALYAAQVKIDKLSFKRKLSKLGGRLRLEIFIADLRVVACAPVCVTKS